MPVDIVTPLVSGRRSMFNLLASFLGGTAAGPWVRPRDNESAGAIRYPLSSRRVVPAQRHHGWPSQDRHWRARAVGHRGDRSAPGPSAVAGTAGQRHTTRAGAAAGNADRDPPASGPGSAFARTRESVGWLGGWPQPGDAVGRVSDGTFCHRRLGRRTRRTAPCGSNLHCGDCCTCRVSTRRYVFGAPATQTMVLSAHK